MIKLEQIRRIVHFGVDVTSPGTSLGMSMKGGEIHYCVEKEPKFLAFANIMSPKKSDAKIIHGTATMAPLKSNFAHEVHIHNILTLPESELDFEQKEEIIREAKRILRVDGSIYIGNTIAPESFPKVLLKKLAQKIGLKVDFEVEDDDGKSNRKLIDNLKFLRTRLGDFYSGRTGLRILKNNPGYYFARLTKKQP